MLTKQIKALFIGKVYFRNSDYFKKKGFNISPFHLEISSNLPIGAGISSSSALISAVAKSLINLFEFKLNKEHIIDSVSYVEKNI